MDELQADIEARVAALDPAIEVIDVQRNGPEALRIFVDHPGGVTLDTCERVTLALGDLRADFALEVSSPGLDRPLAKPDHYRRYVGRTVRVRTNVPLDGQRNFTGRLLAADAERISIDAEAGRTEIPLDRVHRSNLVPDPSEVVS